MGNISPQWFLVSSNVLPASLFHLYVNAKSDWWWLTYRLFKIAGRSQRRPFFKTTVILKPQMDLWHPHSYASHKQYLAFASAGSLSWGLCSVGGILEDFCGHEWRQPTLSSGGFYVGEEKKPQVLNSTFQWLKELIENVAVRPTPISSLPRRTSHFLVAEFVFPWVLALIGIVITA